MIVLGLIGALLTIFIAGFGVTMSIFARQGRINFVECACLTWLLGVGIVSLLLWIFGWFCSGFVLQIVVAVVCVPLAFFGWRLKRNRFLVIVDLRLVLFGVCAADRRRGCV